VSAGHILVVDDEPDILQLVREILQDEGYEVDVASSAAAARQARRAHRPDLTLLDVWMPDTDGITLLKEWSEGTELDSPVIIMSGHGTVETAVEATRLGAYDFIEKPLSMAKLLLTVRRALESSWLRRENVGLRRRGSPVVEPVGRSPAMQALREQVKRVAPHDTAVLLYGESGSGKQVVARHLHSASPRHGAPFVDVAVAGMSGDGTSVELFGSEENESIHYGWLEQANGGTLYLSDIADMDLSTQARLLNALQHRSVLRVGGKEPVRIDVRIVAATARDLAGEVARGRFRDDLYYHLNVLPIRVPSLRQHREDVPELLEYYVGQFVAQEKLPYRRFTTAAQNFLRNYAWPGNVRELKNLVQRLLILGIGEEVPVAEVEAAVGTGGAQVPAAASSAPGTDLFSLPLRDARDLFEKQYLEHLLREADGNVSRVAQRAGLERTHLYRKLRGLGIDPRRLEDAP
jgi:DNA-binding NtrC family response regulator